MAQEQLGAGRKGEREKEGPLTLRRLSSEWIEKLGLQKLVLNQFINALVKEAIAVVLTSAQHRTGEAGGRERSSLVESIFINSSVSYFQSLCLIHVRL